MTKLGNNKFEVRVVLCYIIGIITSGIIVSIWLALAMDWVISIFFLGMWWFAFLIMPFGMDMEGRRSAQRDRQSKTTEYIRDR